MIRRSALEEIGGFAVETVTEDSHTALKLQRRGWNTAFLPIPLAAGLATERLALHIGQRMRWARGMTQILRLDNPLLGRGLRLPQRLCYLNAMLHFQFALPRIVFLTAPTAYLILGQNVIAASAPAVFAYALPHLAHSIMTNARIQGRHRYSFWGELYETVLAFHVLKPTLVTLITPKRGKFNVTDKGEVLDRGFFDFALVKPHLLTAALLATAITVGLFRYFYIDWFPIDPKVLALNIGWALFSLVVLLAASAVAMESRQLRSTTRLKLKLPVVLHFDNGRSWQGKPSTSPWVASGSFRRGPQSRCRAGSSASKSPARDVPRCFLHTSW
ncbi:glycosyltransferase family 2 protein [Azorhizophilus paspali]|uniref:glycosyltransferase family 2 protein n=1 Tax=Azorhizophilus paspali TaxID=69963 RepID=UPI0036399D16